ncbi:MAG: alanine--glyoxylate aminotransferase family protein [Actinomycetota bacterium]|nr:alanine--glyoxylate aminotransferase family protein [Actinomycetota bacterium]MDH5225034.1 alanine--glyoxylate aminotransferase family protein [Actinomycetota bacterium]
MDRPEIILAPGPTPIPPQVLLAQGSPLVYHRGPGFGSIMREVTERLRLLYRTETADVLVMTSSGTGGLESAISNCFSPGDEVLVPVAGFFAERFKALAETFGLTVLTIDYEWGERIRPDEVAAALAEHPVKAVLLTQSETSTGVIQPIERLAKVANEAGAMVMVDVVSSLGAVPFEFDAWGIDVAVGGSQKALSASPGIAFVAISDRAWRATHEATNPRFYFDWATYKRFADLPDPENPWTPAISVMQGLQAALELYFQHGVDAAMARHRMLSRAVKEGAKALGLDLFGEGLDDNWTVTAIRSPESADADTISDTIRAEHGCVLAPGQGPLKGKVFRIGHFGYVSELDIIRGLAALEMTLESLGHPVKRGAAVAAAETVFMESRTP